MNYTVLLTGIVSICDESEFDEDAKTDDCTSVLWLLLFEKLLFLVLVILIMLDS